MEAEVSKSVTDAAARLAKEIHADAILVMTEKGESYDMISGMKLRIPVVAVTTDEATFQKIARKTKKIVKLSTRELSKDLQAESAVVLATFKGLIKDKDKVVIVGSTPEGVADSIWLYNVQKDRLDFGMYDFMKIARIKQKVFDATLNIALEIGREGREGRLIGTAFIVGDSKRVLNRSTQLVMNPFEGHSSEERKITNPNMKESIKELAQLDGVFIVSREGVIKSAGRYIIADVQNVDLPLGLGSRHAAVASITKETGSIGITVSKSGGIVRIFKEGKPIMTIEPQKRVVLSSECS